MLPFKRLVKKQLGELLIERGVVTRAQLEKALQVQKEKGGLLGQILVVLGYTKEEEIAQALTVQYGFPYLPLQNYELNREVVKLIPENVSKEYCLIAVDKIGDTLTVAMSNPLYTASAFPFPSWRAHLMSRSGCSTIICWIRSIVPSVEWPSTKISSV